MKISQEWAKQLVHDVIGQELDFAGMKVINIQPNIGTCYMVPIYHELPMISWEQDSEADQFETSFEMEKIELKKIGDPINREVTVLGYGPRTNILALGETYEIKYKP